MTIPNYITILRILLVPFFYTAVAYSHPGNDHWRLIAISIFISACVTDAIDGFISRKWNMKSELGTFLDPLADKLLLISAFVSLYFSDLSFKPPLWTLILVVFREIFILAGLVVVYLTSKTVRIEPNLLGKATTCVQMLTIVVALLELELVYLFWTVTAGLTVASGIVYIVREMKRLNHA